MVRDRLPALERIQHGRVNVRGATDGWSVAENVRRLSDRGDDLFPARGAALGRIRAGPSERARAEQGPGPGPEILGAEPLPHDFLDVLVDVPPLHVDGPAVLGDVIEDVPARELFQIPDDGSDHSIARLHHLTLAGLSREVVAHEVALHRHVPVAQGRDAVAAVFGRVDPTSRTQERGGQDPENAGHHLFARQPRESEVPPDGRAHLRESFQEMNEAAEFLRLAPPHVRVVVTVLPSSRLVAADRLERGPRGGRDRRALPGRRQHQGSDPLEVVRSRRLSARRHVPEALLRRAEPTDARLLQSLDSRQ